MAVCNLVEYSINPVFNFGIFYAKAGGIYLPCRHDCIYNSSGGYGIGTTVNMASKAGKGTILFIIIALLMLPLVCVWVIAEEFTPIHLEIENQSLCAEQIRTDYEISLDDLDDVEILTELPNWSRVNGTGM